jgi:hypothetical protein
MGWADKQGKTDFDLDFPLTCVQNVQHLKRFSLGISIFCRLNQAIIDTSCMGTGTKVKVKKRMENKGLLTTMATLMFGKAYPKLGVVQSLT